MLTTAVLVARFFIGIVKRIMSDTYYRTLFVMTFIVLLIGTLFAWLVAEWPLLESALYAVTTMSMNTPYGGPLVGSAGVTMKCFHMAYTFLSVGVFIVFTMETGKTMIATYEETMQKMAERRAKKKAAE